MNPNLVLKKISSFKKNTSFIERAYRKSIQFKNFIKCVFQYLKVPPKNQFNTRLSKIHVIVLYMRMYIILY